MAGFFHRLKALFAPGEGDLAGRPARRPPLGPRPLALAGLMAAMTAVLAYVRIPLPFSPVPVSGQTLAVMLAGAVLGPRLGALSQTVYVLLCAIGLPVFAGGLGGLGVLAGPTGGYLIGFVLGAYTTGWLLAGVPQPGLARSLVAFTMGGVVAVYIPGVLQLALVMDIPVSQAFVLGAVPFLIGDAVKVLAATAALQALRPVLALGYATGRD